MPASRDQGEDSNRPAGARLTEQPVNHTCPRPTVSTLASLHRGNRNRQDRLVRITVRLFAGLRERAGRSQVELENVTRVEDVWPRLDLGAEPPGLLYAVNRQYVEHGQELVDGDEVALIPPVSGGSFTLVDGPLDIAAALREVEDPRAGAVASFVGTVRGHSRGRDVVHLEYEAYEEMAEPMLARLGDGLMERHGLCAVAIHHRLGRVEIGEASVVIAVSAPHRSAALDACREAIETLKTTIPLWKKEVYAGGEEWIGRGS
jgi:molybdopterin synthase catalytic subunit/molybdopterin converting factor small subunit